MTPKSIRRLLSIHRVAGLVVSLNLLVVSLTGVILIFHEEIDEALGTVPRAELGEHQVPLSELVASARREQPRANPVYVFQDPDEHPGVVFVGMAEGSRLFEDAKPLTYARSSGALLPRVDFEDTFTGFVLRLHAQLLLGPVGSLLVGLVGVAYFVTLITGAMIYGPMMRRFSFGMLRRDKQRRTFFADVHKWLGAATFGWNAVVALTGILLTLGSTLLQLYSATELAALGRPYAREAVVEDLGTLDVAIADAERGARGKRWSFVALPGSDLASPRHYSVLLQGREGLESRMLSIALVDARDPARIEQRELPWYLRVVLLSEPLHFGDYGGLPLKLTWAGFSLVTIAMAVTGVYVHLASRKQKGARERVAPIDAALEEASS